MAEYDESWRESDLTVLFLSGAPLKNLSWEGIVDISTVQGQEKLLHSTILHNTCTQFPLDAEYRRKFLKKVIDAVESCNTEVCEELYTSYVDCLTEASTKSEFSYKSYYLHSIRKYVTLMESSIFLCSGTTGLTTWQGAKVLADWCIRNKALFTNKRIIELGAGIGLSGIIVVKSCDPLSYVFTDYHDKVLKILNYNVGLNFSELPVIHTDNSEILNDSLMLPSRFVSGRTDISVDRIDWTDEYGLNAVMKDSGVFDVILAADVVFEPSIICSLVQTLSNIMHVANQANTRCVAYVAVAVRNRETFNQFCEELTLKSFQFQELEISLPCMFYIDPIFTVKLLKIVLDTMKS